MGQDLIQNAGLANVAFIEDLFQRYQENPGALPSSWNAYFRAVDGENKSAPPAPQAPVDGASPKPVAATTTYKDTSVNIYNLIQAYRTYGHLLARVNPIATDCTASLPELDLQRFGLDESQLDTLFPTLGVLREPQATLRTLLEALKETYCDSIGVEYMGLLSPAMESWLQEQIEPSRFTPNLSIDQKRLILQNLNKSELFEVFLHTKYAGQKRFSVEGAETLIPMLAALMERGASIGAQDFVIGMAHRGRLNVLSNILNKSYSTIFSEFQEGYIPDSFEGSGDVKYHKGFASKLVTSSGHSILVELTPNPSHLESVDPVVQGQARARQAQSGDEDQRKKVLPILIHGDAAIAGQGIVYETLQLYNLEGYKTGGTLHIVVNNQIGFTTLPRDGRSTHYSTAIARSFQAPVFHVNAEDPEGCVWATLLAVEIRQRFHCDVFIELNCYRKFGHNEGDEPAFTQPLEYQLIRQKKPIRELYRDNLISQGIVERKMAEDLEQEFRSSLDKALSSVKESPKETAVPSRDETRSSPKEDRLLFAPIDTSVAEPLLKEMAARFCTIPKDFQINRKLKRIVEERGKAMETPSSTSSLDWGLAEHLAFASLLWEGRNVRLSGQDSCRGTFSHRHAVWIDQENAKPYTPLSQLKEGQGRMEVYNSPLSEYAVMGFEFGYSMTRPHDLVLWEAQFGDFCNGAQIIIDQFLATCEQKWGKSCGLVLLLPHGYEGQGPEHSSARIERFLQLCGDANMQVVNPSTPAQLFHLFRRQALLEVKKPLVIFTPKGLLRHPRCVSSLNELTQGGFEEFLVDPTPPETTERLILCSGRVYYDLLEEREARSFKGAAIARMEQLYPVNTEKLQALFEKYQGFKQCYWVQEEPSNMGAWNFVTPWLQRYLPKGVEPKFVGRPRSASPAAGSFAVHKRQLAALLTDAFRGLEQVETSD